MSQPEPSGQTEKYLERDHNALLQEIEDLKAQLRSPDWDKPVSSESLDEGRRVLRRMIKSAGLFGTPRHHTVTIELLLNLVSSLKPQLKTLYLSMSSELLEEFVAFQVFGRDWIGLNGLRAPGVEGLLRLSEGFAKYSALVGYWTATAPNDPSADSRRTASRIPWLHSADTPRQTEEVPQFEVEKLADLRDMHWISNLYAARRAFQMLEQNSIRETSARLDAIAGRMSAEHQEDLAALFATVVGALRGMHARKDQQEALLRLIEHWSFRALLNGYDAGLAATKLGPSTP